MAAAAAADLGGRPRPWRPVVEGFGLVSDGEAEAAEERVWRYGSGVPYAEEEAVAPRRRLSRWVALRPGDEETVLPIGLVEESSGEDGPPLKASDAMIRKTESEDE